MKRIIILCLLLALIVACQPTPEKEFVVNKGDDLLSEAIGKNGAGFSVASYRSALPVVWEESVETRSSAVTLSFNAEVLFPDLDELPTVEVAPRGNDLDALLWLGEHIAEGGYYARIPVDVNGEKLRTKAVVLSDLESNRSMSDRAETDHPEWSVQEIAAYREGLEQEAKALAEEYNAASDETAERIDDLSALQNGGMIQIGLFSKSGHNIADVTLVFDPHNPQREQLTIWGSGTDPECFSFWPEPINDTEAAIRAGEQILKELGYDSHYAVAEAAEGLAGVGVIFAPKIQDVGYALGGEDPIASYEEYFPEDRLELIFAKGTGILRYVQWTGNSRFVREASNSVALLPFSEIQGIVKKDLGYLLSWTNENVRERAITITAIRLCYKRVRVLNDQKRLLVPAWAIEGSVTDRGVSKDADTGASELFTTETLHGTLLVVNAVDGTVIETANNP